MWIFPNYMGKVEQHQTKAHSSFIFRVTRSVRGRRAGGVHWNTSRLIHCCWTAGESVTVKGSVTMLLQSLVFWTPSGWFCSAVTVSDAGLRYRTTGIQRSCPTFLFVASEHQSVHKTVNWNCSFEALVGHLGRSCSLSSKRHSLAY